MNQGFNKNLIILFIITPLMFIIAGIGLICAGSLDNMVAGISMLMLAAWLYLFFIVAFEWLGCTVSLKGNELVCRKGINRVQHIALDTVEEIAFGYDGIRGECLKLILKSGEVIVVPGVKDGWKLVRKVRKSVPVSAPSKTIEVLEKECLKAIKKRIVLIAEIVVLLLVLVISLAVAIIATEGKEIDYFNERDWWFFGVFMSIFVLCLFGVLAFMPSLFRLIRDEQGKIWAWKRGMLFEDTLELTWAQEVYVPLGVDARFSYKKEIVNDEEKVISSMEVYMLKKRKMEKKSVLFYDAEAEAFWEKVIGDDDARPITELINSPGIFRL